jgi:hypothetical protein
LSDNNEAVSVDLVVLHDFPALLAVCVEDELEAIFRPNFNFDCFFDLWQSPSSDLRFMAIVLAVFEQSLERKSGFTIRLPARSNKVTVDGKRANHVPGNQDYRCSLCSLRPPNGASQDSGRKPH